MKEALCINNQTFIILSNLVNPNSVIVFIVSLPIIYFTYYNSNYKDNTEGIKAYLIRAVLFTYFQSGTTSKLQRIKSNINEYDYEITIDMLDQMNDLSVTDSSKNEMLLIDYYNDMNDEQKKIFCEQALIPDGISLKLDKFDEFHEKRKAILTSKLKTLLG